MSFELKDLTVFLTKLGLLKTAFEGVYIVHCTDGNVSKVFVNGEIRIKSEITLMAVSDFKGQITQKLKELKIMSDSFTGRVECRCAAGCVKEVWVATKLK